MTDFIAPTLDDIRAAAARIASHARVTPVLREEALDDIAGATLFFKCEHLQRGGAFKFRGACNAVWSLTDAEARCGVVTHSSGNHGAALVHPYADARVVAGQGTVVLELLQQEPELDVVVAPVGGGGLVSGCAIVLRALLPSCDVVGAEPAGADDAFQSLQRGQRVTDIVPETICDGLRATVGVPNFAMLEQYRVEIITVDDDATLAAMRLLWKELKQTVEPSSATVLAAVLAQPGRFAGKRIGLVLTGGNVDLDRLPFGSK